MRVSRRSARWHAHCALLCVAFAFCQIGTLSEINMQDSDLLFNTVSAIAIGLAVSIAPGAARSASDDLRANHLTASAFGARVGQSDVDADGSAIALKKAGKSCKPSSSAL